MADSPNLNEITTTTQRNRKMGYEKDEGSKGEYNFGGSEGAADPSMNTAPYRKSTPQAATFRSAGQTKDGALRNSGHSGAHRIGGKNPGGHCIGKKKK